MAGKRAIVLAGDGVSTTVFEPENSIYNFLPAAERMGIRKAESMFNCADSIREGLEYCAAKRLPLLMTHGRFPTADTASIGVDVKDTGIISDGQAEIYTETASEEPIFDVYSSATYPETPKNTRLAMGSLLFRNNASETAPLARTAIRIGSLTHDAVGMFRLSDISIQSFALGFEFIANAWKVHISDFQLKGSGIYCAPATPNCGECMKLENGFIAGLTGVVDVILGTGFWHIKETSFDVLSLRLIAEVYCWVNGGHFEQPGGPPISYNMFRVEHPEALLVLNGVEFVLNPRQDEMPFTESYGWVCESSNAIKGATLMDCTFPDPPYYQANPRVYVSGPGRSRVKNCTGWNASQGAAGSESQSALFNGSAEEGHPGGWSFDDTSVGELTADDTDPHSGSYSFKLASAEGYSATFQDVPCQPTDILGFTGVIKVDGTEDGYATIGCEWLNAYNQKIGAGFFRMFDETATDWTISPLRAVAPKGAALCRLLIQAVGCEAKFDGQILTVC